MAAPHPARQPTPPPAHPRHRAHHRPRHRHRNTGEVAELTGYGPITPAQAQAITADGTLRRLLCDPATGALLDYGRTTYRPPTALADHVLTRDATCIMPGCRQPSYRTEIDHTTPYSAGGTTSATSLGGCCKHHHRAKDGGEYTLTRTGDTYHWTTPLGRTYTREPTPLWDPPPPTPPPAPPRTNGETADQPSDPAPPPENPPF